MTNYKIRAALKDKRMFYYELAELLGISEFTLSRKLRNELPDEEQNRIISIIKENAR